MFARSFAITLLCTICFLVSTVSLADDLYRRIEDAPCPVSAVAYPLNPAGSKTPIFYSDNKPLPYNTSGPVVSRCCPSGVVAFWNLTATASENLRYLGSLGAYCSEGTVLAPVVYGANGTNPTARTPDLLDPELVSIPVNGTYTYWNGAILDVFMGVGGKPNGPIYSLQCPAETQAVGFSVASSYFAVTQFQLVCAVPRAPSLATGLSG